MVYINKNEYDKHYPYTLEDSWGGKVYCDEEALRKLKTDIEKILEKK